MGLKESGLRGSLRNVSVGVDTIPDDVVIRPDDDEDFEADAERFDGLVVKLLDDWGSIGQIISNLTENATIAVLNDEDGNEIESVDVEGLSSGDSFTFDNVNLKDGDEVQIVLSNLSESWTVGRADGTRDTYPISSEKIEIVAIIEDGNRREDADARAVNNIGNTGID